MVTAVERVENQRARLVLRPDPAVAARVANLMVRETDCCSFFEFTLSATGGALTLDVTVPPGQIQVLNALLDRARGAAGSFPARHGYLDPDDRSIAFGMIIANRSAVRGGRFGRDR